MKLEVAESPLQDSTVRLDQCEIRMKDGTWVRIPENTQVASRDIKDALEMHPDGLTLFFGIPTLQDVRPNVVPITGGYDEREIRRYRVAQTQRPDENTGENEQVVQVRRMQGKIFVGDEVTTGYQTVRIGRVKRSDKPGNPPKFDEVGCGPMLAIQANDDLSGIVSSVVDQIRGKSDKLAATAIEMRMSLSDGLGDNLRHMLILQALNSVRGELDALMQSNVIHPYDIYVNFARLIGGLAMFDTSVMAPRDIPEYDHDAPASTLDLLRRKIELLLSLIFPEGYEVRNFEQQRDINGVRWLQVSLDRKWLDENCELYVAFEAAELDENELDFKLGERGFNLKLGSPKRAPTLVNAAVKGLRFRRVSVRPGLGLPNRAGLYYFKVDKTTGMVGGVDYWKECEDERAIRMGLPTHQLEEMEGYKPAIYVPTRT